MESPERQVVEWALQTVTIAVTHSLVGVHGPETDLQSHLIGSPWSSRKFDYGAKMVVVFTFGALGELVGRTH